MDFNSLVNEILRMAKDSADERKRKAGGNPNISWDNTPAGEAYWKDIRARNTALETGKQTDLGTLARQRLGGQQAMELGQQQGEFSIRGNEITAGTERYKADQSLEAAKYTANAKDNSLSGLLKTEGKPAGATPEDVRSFDRTVAPPPPIIPNKPATPGAQSMVFDSTDREALARSRKKQEDLLLYGTKPQKRSWLSAL